MLFSVLSFLWLAASAPVPNSLPDIRFETPTLDVVALRPNAYQYQDGYFLWRMDYLYHTVIVDGDTLGRDLMISDMPDFIQAHDFADSTRVELIMTIMRYDYASTGHIWRGPYPVYRFDLDQIEAKERRTKQRFQVRPK